MNGPLLVSLLPPERIWDSAVGISDSTPFVAVLLLIGFLLSLLLRHPDDEPFPDRQGATSSARVEAEGGAVKDRKRRELLGRYIFVTKEAE